MALVDDLMDRSRLAAALPGVEFASSVDACRGADTVVVDLGRHAEAVAAARAVAPDAWLVAFGSHVDEATLEAARAAGADRVLPRSRFFRDPAEAMTGPEGGGPEVGGDRT